jgi:predicted Zn-dependent peptidase
MVNKRRLMCPMREVKASRISNGVRIISEEIPQSSSASIGIWIDVGSRDEDNNYQGCSHFLEHLLFKGTTNRNAKEISTIIEQRGGYLNAFTDRDMTCFQVKVLGSDILIALDVLSDIVQNPLLKQEDIDKERTVILSEIDSRDDDPGDLIHDLYFETSWGESNAAHPILGEKEVLKTLNNTAIRLFYEKHYTPLKMIVTAAGEINHKELVSIVKEKLSYNKPSQTESRKTPIYRPTRRHIPRLTNQAQVALTTKGVSYNDSSRDALNLINSYLGVGASSKLFQEVREKHGLVYSIFCTSYSLGDTGIFAILAGTQDRYVEKVLKIELKELSKLRKVLTKIELEKIKHKTTGFFVLHSESSESRMMQLGVSTLRQGRPKTMNETIEGINAVKPEDIKELAECIFNIDQLGLTTLGLSVKTAKKIDSLF